MKIKIGTRKSKLAIEQTKMVIDEINRSFSDIQTEIVYITTSGDKILDKPLTEIGGKGVFVSEIENALLDGSIDIAVHSAKDLPTSLAEGLAISGVLKRGDPGDALITNKGTHIDYQTCFTAGTSSERRRTELSKLYPNVIHADIRGNVDTRLKATMMLPGFTYDYMWQDKTYGGIAAALTVFGKKAQMICARTGCILLGINQIREDMAGFNRVITTGGKGWKHLCTFRFIFKKGDYIDENNNSIKRSSTSPAGNLIEIAIVKDKAVKPDRLNGYYTLKYDTGVDILNDTIELACWYDIIRKRGSYFDIINIETGELLTEKVSTETGDILQELKFQGKANLLEFLKNRNDIFNLIYTQVIKKLEE